MTVTPGATLHDAARAMAERKVGAAVVIDPEQPGPGIITERDLLLSVGSGQDPNSRAACATTSRPELTFAAPDWSLERAAEAMVRGGFRHLVVVDGGEMRGRALDARHRPLLGARTARRPSCRATWRARSSTGRTRASPFGSVLERQL